MCVAWAKVERGEGGSSAEVVEVYTMSPRRERGVIGGDEVAEDAEENDAPVAIDPVR